MDIKLIQSQNCQVAEFLLESVNLIPQGNLGTPCYYPSFRGDLTRLGYLPTSAMKMAVLRRVSSGPTAPLF